MGKILKGISSNEFVLLYGSGKPIKKYIDDLELKCSSLVNFNSYSGPYFDNLINNKKVAVRLPLRVLIRLISPFLCMIHFIKLKWYISSMHINKFDRIIVNSGCFDGNLSSRLFLRLINRKCTYILHNHVPQDILKNSEKFSSVAKHVDKWIVGSKVIRDQLIESNCVLPENVYFIPYGLDSSKELPGIDCSLIRRKLGVSKNTFLVLHPSVFEKRKGHYYTISAFKEFKNRVIDSKLVLAGSNGVDERAIRRLVNELGIQNDVIFTGFYSPIEELIKACDVLCLPSQEYDTTSFVILLGLACGTPVLTTKRKDFDSFLKDEYNALLVPKEDYRTITDKLMKLYDDHSLREKLIKNGLSAHFNYFSEDKMVKGTVSVLMN